MATTIWQERGTGKKFVFDAEAMKKTEYSHKACRMPVPVEPTEVVLFDSEWVDDNESYVLCDKKYLTAPK
jgi:hypothetical protein